MTSQLVGVVGLLTTSFMAGLLFVFSSSVMPALSQSDRPAGLTAMAMINRSILNPIFGLAFIGSLGAGVAAVVVGTSDLPSRLLLVLAGVLHLGGFLLVTVTVHLPLNTSFERLDPSEPADLDEWAQGVRTWARFNHVRSAATLCASIAYASFLYCCV